MMTTSPVGLGEAARDRRALALVGLLQEDADAAGAVELGQDVAGAVGGPVVDDQDFLVDRAEIHGLHPRDDLADRGLLVEAGHHHRQFHARQL